MADLKEDLGFKNVNVIEEPDLLESMEGGLSDDGKGDDEEENE